MLRESEIGALIRKTVSEHHSKMISEGIKCKPMPEFLIELLNGGTETESLDGIKVRYRWFTNCATGGTGTRSPSWGTMDFGYDFVNGLIQSGITGEKI